MRIKIRKREPFLASSVPNLGLDNVVIDTDCAGGEFDTDSGLGLEAELVFGEARQEVGFADTGVTYEYQLEEVVVVIFCSVRRHRDSLGTRINIIRY